MLRKPVDTAPAIAPLAVLPVFLRLEGRRAVVAGAFAVAALEEEEDCAAFVAAARARGVVVNAVDRPHLCDVQFGAIVNRSPLVVGISTGGAAPVFGQAVRSRIEALLPRGFARWVEAAARWRDAVAARLAA